MAGAGRTAKGQLEVVAGQVARRTIELGYSRWDWGEGVAWHGVAEAAVRLEDPVLLDAAVKWLHSHAETVPRQLRQVMPGLAATTVHAAIGDSVALDLGRRVITLLEANPRNVHGAYRESTEIPVWIDYWYEITPFLAAMARLTGEARYLDWAAQQSLAFIHACWDPAVSLYHHAYYDLIHQTSQWFWARANGWAALAAVEMLTALQDVPEVTPTLSKVLQDQMGRIAELQDESGRWHTVLDQPSTYLETSASVMFALAMRRGISRGYLDATFTSACERAFAACLAAIDKDGNVKEVSAETPPGDILHYSTIPLGVYPWGQGFTLLALLEWLGRDG